MTSAERAKRCARRKEEILEEATRLFAAKGYAHAKIDDIALRLGIAKGTIYRYFPTKKALFLAVADNAMAELQDSMHAITSKIEDPLERISAGVRAHLAFFDRHRDLIEVFVHERAEFRDRKKPTFLSYREKNIKDLEALLKDMKKAGLVRDISASATAEILGDMQNENEDPPENRPDESYENRRADSAVCCGDCFVHRSCSCSGLRGERAVL